MRLDWWSVTCSDPEGRIGSRLAFEAKVAGAQRTKQSVGSMGFDWRVSQALDEGGSLVIQGGNKGRCWLTGTGKGAGRAADLMALWPDADWRCTRVDVCRDLRTDDYVGLADAVSHAVWACRGPKSQRTVVGDWLDGGERGRTVYLGAASSQVRVRVYEKGKQLGRGARTDWVRVEVQWRPEGAAALAIARERPILPYGLAWMPERGRVALGVGREELTPAPPEIQGSTGWRSSLSHMLDQYHRVLVDASACEGLDWLLDEVRQSISKTDG